MKITVPQWAREHFWEEPPADSQEFWGLRWKPKCHEGETIEFYFDKELVATATVARIEPPGRSACDGTGRFGTLWKVFWTQESFRDLRDRPLMKSGRPPAGPRTA